MPELPEVETVRIGLAPYVEGAIIAKMTLHHAHLRKAIPHDMPTTVAGKKVKSLIRHGKTMIWQMAGAPDIAWHLGMSGSFRVEPNAKAPLKKHDHVEILLKDGPRLIFNDPRRFGSLDYASGDMPGIDPMTPEFSAAAFRTMLTDKKTPIKSLLLDQMLVSGVGNIYACEALFYSKIHPTTPAGGLSKAKADSLHQAVIDVLKRAVASGGSSLRDHVMVNGEAGKFQHEFAVYGRKGKPCIVCHTMIEKTVLAGRGTFFCPHCQRSKLSTQKA